MHRLNSRMNSTRRAFLVLATLVSVLFSATAFADDIADRMKARVPAIDALLKSGRAGENYQGYLEARDSLNSAEQSLVKDENLDRKAVYKRIATKNGLDTDKVAQLRAEQIRSSAKGGTWVQLPSGSWVKK